MDTHPKLIFLNGPIAAGKSTIAQMYADNHAFAMVLSIDDFVGSMGKWLENEEKARELSLEYILQIAQAHLKTGYDVVVPYLLEKTADIERLEAVVAESGAVLFEFALIAPHDEIIEKAIKRGTWGEPGSPPLTENDRPIVEDRYQKFEATLHKRPKSIRIHVKEGDAMNTYNAVLNHIDA